MKLNVENIFLVLIFIFMLILPFFTEIHRPVLYYLGSVTLIIVAIYKMLNVVKYEKKFYKRWHVARQQNYRTRIALESFRWFIYILLITTGVSIVLCKLSCSGRSG